MNKLLKENINDVRARLQAAAGRSGQDGVLLVAVTKTVPVTDVGEALALGLQSFGENRVQDALTKVDTYPQADWHFIGRLQTNKVKEVVGRFSLIHSLDRWNLAEALQKHAAAQDLRQNVLIQINISDEPQKGGLEPAALPDFLMSVKDLSHLCVQGLMTVPSFEDDAEKIRPYFRRMYQLFQDCRVPGVQMRYLSMGMSHDFETAVEEGANLVRIGSAIFGDRN